MKVNILIFIITIFSALNSFAQVGSYQLKLLRSYEEHTSEIEYLTFHPSGNYIASADRIGSIHIFDVNTGITTHTQHEHKAAVNHLTFNTKGNLLASADDNGVIKVWDIEKDKIILTLNNPPLLSYYKSAYFVLFSPDENYLYFGGINGKICKANIANRKIQNLYEQNNAVTCAAYTPENTYLVFGCGKSIQFLNLETQKIDKKLTTADFVNDIQFSPKGNLLLAWTQNGVFNIFSYPSGEYLYVQKAGNFNDYSHLAFTSDGNFLATGCDKNAFNIFDMNTKSFVNTTNQHTKPVRTLCFSPNNNILATGSYDKTIKIWKKEEIITKSITPAPTNTTPIETPVILKARQITDKTTLKVNNSELTVHIWDDKEPDGDVISVFFNNACVLDKYPTEHKKKTIKLKIEPNTTANLVMYAHNLGKRPPNTAAISINDGVQTRKIELSSDLNTSESIKIMYYPKNK